MPYSIQEELNILDPKKIEIRRDKFNKLSLKIEGDKEYPEVRASMSFPLTDPEKFVSIVEIEDGKKGEEIGTIEDVGKLNSESKKILKEDLKRSYFMPRITKINRMKENHGIMKFDVETDSGSREFETRYKEDIRKLSGIRVVIRDADGNRYDIPNYNKLDQRSIHLLDSEM